MNHTLLTVNIAIIEEHIQTKKYTIVKNSEKETNFLTKLIDLIRRLDTKCISSKKVLEQIVQEFADNTKKIWFKHSKIVNITKHSKLWWNKECQRALKKYRFSKQVKEWRILRSIVKKTKCVFFDNEIAEKNSSPWKLINWVKKHKPPAIKAIQYNSWPYLKLDNLWQTLHSLFNSAQNCQVN